MNSESLIKKCVILIIVVSIIPIIILYMLINDNRLGAKDIDEYHTMVLDYVEK